MGREQQAGKRRQALDDASEVFHDPVPSEDLNEEATIIARGRAGQAGSGCAERQGREPFAKSDRRAVDRPDVKATLHKSAARPLTDYFNSSPLITVTTPRSIFAGVEADHRFIADHLGTVDGAGGHGDGVARPEEEFAAQRAD